MSHPNVTAKNETPELLFQQRQRITALEQENARLREAYEELRVAANRLAARDAAYFGAAPPATPDQETP